VRDEKLITQYCHRLVTAIEETRKQPLHSSVREAFLQVPRHLFVDVYYQGNEQIAPPVAHDEERWHHWLAQVYRDVVLVTKKDERGMLTSSSSQPSVMAGMLEVLDLHTGQTVLEIGTGTGYNAALLAKLVENPNLVTTVDIDPALVETACTHIEQGVGPGMTVQAWNGIDGYAPHALYDRIITAGSFFPVPWAWIEQLKPGGKLVMDLHGQMGGGLMLIIKQPDGQAIGHFLNEWRHISFMRLRSMHGEDIHLRLEEDERFPLLEHVYLSPDDPAYRCASHFAFFKQFIGQENALNIWLQSIFPGLSIMWKRLASEALSVVLTDHATRTAIIIHPQENGLEIVVRGKRCLWSDLLYAYQDWLACGMPGLEAYTLRIDWRGQQVMHVNGQKGNARTFLLHR
jgi:protein-L-isoaspartate(D-aspartate) O-methyltransferase